MKTFYVITDTKNSNEHTMYVGDLLELNHDIEMALKFETLKEAKDFIKENEIEDWAGIEEEEDHSVDLQVTRIEKRFTGYGHNEVTITVTGTLIDNEGVREVEDFELKTTSTNTMATDAYFDEYFDENLDNENSFYESRYEAAEALIDEVFRKHEVESDYEIEDLMTTEEVKELRESLKNE